MIGDNYWIGNYILSPILTICMLGAASWYARRKDELAAKIKKMHTCNDTCHGSNDNYIYGNFDALQGVHALEQRVAKLEEELNERITITRN
ncbi:hypothetical protein [Methylobacter sp.]|uniref:hypothetical protein n=1 Tax=Methylobacter sp. TaxID=2051955 RepID=UPI003DA46983